MRHARPETDPRGKDASSSRGITGSLVILRTYRYDVLPADDGIEGDMNTDATDGIPAVKVRYGEGVDEGTDRTE